MSTPASVARDLVGLGIATQIEVAGIVKVHGALLQAAVKRRAALPRTGPPGPRIITGSYNRSITRRTSSTVGMASVEVGTNAPQGRRLELGFTGYDSLGRYYDQPPYPHFGPGLEEIRPAFMAAMAAAGIPRR